MNQIMVKQQVMAENPNSQVPKKQNNYSNFYNENTLEDRISYATSIIISRK